MANELLFGIQTNGIKHAHEDAMPDTHNPRNTLARDVHGNPGREQAIACVEWMREQWAGAQARASGDDALS